VRLHDEHVAAANAFTKARSNLAIGELNDVGFVLHEIYVLNELTLGHLRYRFTDVPPQPNSPSDSVSRVDHPEGLKSRS